MPPNDILHIPNPNHKTLKPQPYHNPKTLIRLEGSLKPSSTLRATFSNKAIATLMCNLEDALCFPWLFSLIILIGQSIIKIENPKRKPWKGDDVRNRR